MNNIEVFIYFFGVNFSTRDLQQKLSVPLIIKAEKGEKATKGFIRGEAYPYSSAEYIFELKSKKQLIPTIKKMKDFIQSNEHILQQFVFEKLYIKVFFKHKTNYHTIILDKKGNILDIDVEFAKTEDGEELLAELNSINKVSINHHYQIIINQKNDINNYNKAILRK